MNPKIKYADLSIKKNKPYLESIKEVLNSGQFILGNQVKVFEKNIKKYCNAKYVLSTSSGTDSLVLSLLAYDISYNDEVIVPDISYIATANAVKLIGAKPIFCDVKDDFNIDANKIEKLITNKTKAIIFVNYAGKIAEVKDLKKISKKYNVILIEDASQSFGSKYRNKFAGTFGEVSAISLNPMKTLGAFGEAGLILTNKKKIYTKLKQIRNNGLDDKKKCVRLGKNAKMDTIQAAILNIRLQDISYEIDRKIEIANIYSKNLNALVSVPKVEKFEKHSYFTYTILATHRNKLLNFLIKKGIEAKVYHTSMSKEPFYKNKKNSKYISNSYRLSKIKLALPCHIHMTNKDIYYIIDSIKEFYRNQYE